MVTRWLVTTLTAAVTILTAAGCDLQTTGGLNPNATSQLGSLLQGTWTSASIEGEAQSFPSAESCIDLEWTITEQDASQYSGSFLATCAGGISLAGTAEGTLLDGVLEITAAGTATPQGGASCPFTLTGTARLEDNAIRLDYTGTSCAGPISGTELLERD